MSKYRHEIKMSINSFDQLVLSSRLSYGLRKDQHVGSAGFYLVRSLYFDDQNNSALQDKLIGIKERVKFRIRTYNNSTAQIRLEKKVKNGSVGYKESAALTLRECQSLLAGEYGFLLDRPEKVCQELYIRMGTGLFWPKTIVEYRREAYEWTPGVRITLDSEIKTGMRSTDFLDFTTPLAPAGEPGTAILEIKYDNYLPAHVSNLIALDSRQKEAISKYVMCRCFG